MLIYKKKLITQQKFTEKHDIVLNFAESLKIYLMRKRLVLTLLAHPFVRACVVGFGSSVSDTGSSILIFLDIYEVLIQV